MKRTIATPTSVLTKDDLRVKAILSVTLSSSVATPRSRINRAIEETQQRQRQTKNEESARRVAARLADLAVLPDFINSVCPESSESSGFTFLGFLGWGESCDFKVSPGQGLSQIDSLVFRDKEGALIIQKLGSNWELFSGPITEATLSCAVRLSKGDAGSFCVRQESPMPAPVVGVRPSQAGSDYEKWKQEGDYRFARTDVFSGRDAKFTYPLTTLVGLADSSGGLGGGQQPEKENPLSAGSPIRARLQLSGMMCCNCQKTVDRTMNENAAEMGQSPGEIFTWMPRSTEEGYVGLTKPVPSQQRLWLANWLRRLMVCSSEGVWFLPLQVDAEWA